MFYFYIGYFRENITRFFNIHISPEEDAIVAEYSVSPIARQSFFQESDNFGPVSFGNAVKLKIFNSEKGREKNQINNARHKADRYQK